MKTVFYEVFINGNHSRYFETKRAAVKWCKYWMKQDCADKVELYQASNRIEVK